MEEKIQIYQYLYHVILLLAIIWYGKYHWTRRRLYKMALKMQGPPWLPIVGNALFFAVPNHEIFPKLLQIMKLYRSPMRMWFGQQLAVFIWHPRDIETVVNNTHSLDKERMIYRHYDFALGNGIGTAPAKMWKKNRRLIQPTFKQRNINGFLPVFIEQSCILSNQLEAVAGKGIFDFYALLNRCTMDMICETAVGVKINAQTTDSEVVRWVEESLDIVAEKIARIWYHVDFIFKRSEMSRTLDKNFGQFKDFIDDIIIKWKDAFERGSPDDQEEKPKTFLQQLLKISEDGVYFTNRQLRDEVISFILAGSETTAATLGFVFVILGLYPDIQERVYQEILDVLGKNGAIEYEDLAKLEYTDRVFKETMRMYPVGPSIARSNTEDIKLDSCTIPAGSTIAIEIICLHYNSEVWTDPYTFNPDRFLPDEVSKRHPYSWLPFSGGPRNCIGLKYAWTSMKTVLVTLVRKYKVTTSYKRIEDICLKHNVTLRTKDGYNIAIEKRS